MWSDSEDLAVISDMYQLEIKIITTKGDMDKNPIVNRIYPCEELKEFAELKNVELNEMVLLHEDDSHFNLIISKDSNLVKMGGLLNKGAFKDDDEEVDTRKDISEEIEVKEIEEKKDLKEDIEKMKIEIKQLKESKLVLEEEYFKCEQLLKKKTEEAAKLSIEVQDLKEMISLEGELKKNMSPQKTEVSMTNEEEYNCTECCFQGTGQAELDNHITIKHRIICRNCGEKFENKPDLMYHRKNKHLESVANCKNKLLDKCKFSSEKCWWRHTEITENKQHVGEHTEEIIKCYFCQKQFENKRTMMIHRKKEHRNLVKKCDQFPESKCRFSDEDCWFIHVMNNPIHKEHMGEKPADSVFQEVKENLEPPIKD